MSKGETSRFQLFLWFWLGAFFLERIGRFSPLTLETLPSLRGFVNWLSFALIIASLLKRSTRATLSATIISQFFYHLYKVDETRGFFLEHWLLACLGNAILLCAIIYSLFKKDLSDPISYIGERSIGALRLLTVVSLTIAGISKLNTSFFSLEHSCASSAYDIMMGYYTFLPNYIWVKKAFPYLATFTELICPTLLLFRSTRYVALILIGGLMFNLGILPPFNSLYDFAGLYIALLILFIPSYEFSTPRWVKPLLPIGVLGGVVILFTYSDPANDIMQRFYLTQVFWWGAFLYFVTLIIRGLCSREQTSDALQGGSLLGSTILAYSIVALFIIKESFTYMGVQHIPAFRMASGLSLSRIHSNHFIVTSLPDLGFNRTARVIRSNDPHIFVGAYYSWTTIESYLAGNKSVDVAMDVEGTVVETPLKPHMATYLYKLLGLSIDSPPAIEFIEPIHCGLH